MLANKSDEVNLTIRQIELVCRYIGWQAGLSYSMKNMYDDAINMFANQYNNNS